jgi:hypothetical protein
MSYYAGPLKWELAVGLVGKILAITLAKQETGDTGFDWTILKEQ